MVINPIFLMFIFRFFKILMKKTEEFNNINKYYLFQQNKKSILKINKSSIKNMKNMADLYA